MARVRGLIEVTLTMTILGWNPRGRRLFLGHGRRDQFLQLPVRQPAVVAVTGVAESLRQRPGVHPVLAPPPGMRRLDDVAIFDLQGIPRLVQPAHPWWRRENWVNARPLPEG